MWRFDVLVHFDTRFALILLLYSRNMHETAILYCINSAIVGTHRFYPLVSQHHSPVTGLMLTTYTYIAQKESGFPKGHVSLRCNDVITVTNTFFSCGIFSTIYYIDIYNILYREIFSSKVLMMQPNIYGTNIFWWCSKKSVTSVDKCDDEKNWPIPGLKQL